ncbi:carbon-nitrogen hydrolase [Podospora fimiseda]|uniref:Carbon-nitrogen hydrolase n=1 Tax=Podospora fimiseda TaxID=252190 RepID=A0AAN6YLG6_9PEZI|nr:carbon-nitrogen hydrolase [Podospora fimiseda]
MAPLIRLGTASPANQPTTAETLAQLEDFARRAAARKIDILLLPEAYIGGYPRGTSFGCVIGGRTPEGREEYLRYFQNAVDLGDTVGDGAGAGQAWIKRQLPGDPLLADSNDGIPNKRGDGTREQLERIARETGVFLVTGLIEKAGGSMYCSAVYVCPKLGIVGKRRKVMPTATERLVWAQGSPATLKAISTVIRGVRINLAAAICWENYMPLVRQSLYAQNINLYLAPTADGRDAWLSLMRTAAIEGRCFVVSSNMCTTSKSYSSVIKPPSAPPTFHEDDDDSHHHHQPSPNSTRRRSSCITSEGFEIALPGSSKTHSSTPTPASRQRRTSVFDENGNEIVLCRKPFQPPPVQQQQHSRPISPSTTYTATSPIVTPSHTTTATTHTAGPISSGGAKHDPSTYTSRGGSAIISPYGDVIAGPQWEDDSGIIYVDVDFDDCIRGRLDIDTAGSYSRNDSFKFSVEGLDLTPLPY